MIIYLKPSALKNIPIKMIITKKRKSQTTRERLDKNKLKENKQRHHCNPGEAQHNLLQCSSHLFNCLYNYNCKFSKKGSKSRQ